MVDTGDLKSPDFIVVRVRVPPPVQQISMSTISHGVVHKVPADLRSVLLADKKALALWEDITPLARNEWLCWVEAVKSEEKRKEHIARVASQLKEGKRRPCCWIGCIHRKDKKLSPSQKFILSKRTKK